MKHVLQFTCINHFLIGHMSRFYCDVKNEMFLTSLGHLNKPIDDFFQFKWALDFFLKDSGQFFRDSPKDVNLYMPSSASSHSLSLLG